MSPSTLQRDAEKKDRVHISPAHLPGAEPSLQTQVEANIISQIIKHSAKMLTQNSYKLWIYYFHSEAWNSPMLMLGPEIKCYMWYCWHENWSKDTFWWELGNSINGFCTLITEQTHCWKHILSGAFLSAFRADHASGTYLFHKLIILHGCFFFL